MFLLVSVLTDLWWHGFDFSWYLTKTDDFGIVYDTHAEGTRTVRGFTLKSPDFTPIYDDVWFAAVKWAARTNHHGNRISLYYITHEIPSFLS